MKKLRKFLAMILSVALIVGIINVKAYAKENDDGEFKGSQENTSIISIIDENEKALKEVHYSHHGSLVNDTNFEEEI